MKTLLRTRFLLLPMLALMLILPFARVQAGGRKTTPREPYKPVYNAISALDATAHTISYTQVNGHGNVSKTFKVTDQTEIEVGGQKATFADLKAGMQVDISPGMDETVADRISAKTAPAEPTPYPTPVRPHH